MNTQQPNHRLTLDTLVTARTDLLASALSETEMVMMNLDKGYYYGLEEVGKTIWDALCTPNLAAPYSVADLCAIVLATYTDAEQKVVEADTLDFLNELLDEELITVQLPG